MARQVLGGLTTLNLATNLDPMFLELYSGSYANMNFASGNVGFGAVPGAYRVDVVSTTGMRVFGGSLRLVDSGSTTGASITPLAAGGGLTISTDGTNMQFAPGGTNRLLLGVGGSVRPGTDNAQTLGDGGLRWSTVYAGTGTINTSDAREKTTVAEFTDAEVNCAAALAKEIGVFQFLASRDEKGATGARLHIGATVQRVIEVMKAHGLEPMRYAFICYDEWEEVNHPAEFKERETEITGTDGNAVMERYQTRAAYTTPAGNRYGFRMDELLAFIARGAVERQDRLEKRIAALEA
jgi:hypothetical protein